MTETAQAFVHPDTGELLETPAEFRKAIDDITEKMVPFWRSRRALREAYADRFEPTLPDRRYRTETQERVYLCPRCGLARIDEKPL